MSSRVLAVIPARHGSTRYPGKPLASILGRPMIEWVVEGVNRSERIDRILVATDDRRIYQSVQGTDATPVMTSPDHESGSDRVAEVARDRECEILVNVQGDEPLVRGRELDRGVDTLIDQPGVPVASFYAHCPPGERENPDAAKVVVDRRQRALYFSRSPIPFDRGGDATYHQHVGIYVFRRDYLLRFQRRDPTPLERAERLEQLRILEHGDPIQMVPLEEPTIGVDRPGDVERVEEKLRERGAG